MRLDYICDTCNDKKTNMEMESFSCECGGQMRLITGSANLSRPFNAGWCDTLKCEVTSWKDQETKAKNHKSRSHPNGFSMIQDDKKWLGELKNIRKYKGDYMKAELPGFKTKHMKKVYDAKRPDIHDTGRKLYSYPK